MSRPFWNAELSSIIFAYIDDKVNMKMFTFRDGEWNTVEGELDGGQFIWKYVRENQ